MISYEMEPKTVALLVIAKDKEAVEARTAARISKKSSETELSGETEITEESSHFAGIGWIIGGAAIVLAAGVVILLIKRKSNAR